MSDLAVFPVARAHYAMRIFLLAEVPYFYLC